MKVGIIKIPKVSFRSMFEVYEKILQHNDIDYDYLDIHDDKFWDKVTTYSLLILRVSQNQDEIRFYENLMPILSNYLHLSCYPNYKTAWHYDDKIKQYYLLKAHNIPVVETYVFYEKKKANEWINDADFPLIFKLKGGAGSTNVKMVRSRRIAKKLINRSFGSGIMQEKFDYFGKLKALNYDLTKIAKYHLKPLANKYFRGKDPYNNYLPHKNYILLQKFYPGNDYDTRVAIIGKRAWAFKRFNRKNDFRASGSNNYDVKRENIDKQCLKIAFEVSKKLGFQSMAFDFIYDEKKNPLIIEISYTYGDYPEFSDGYWDENLNWHDGFYVPEYLELVDALNYPELKLPDITIDSPYRKAKMNK